MKDFLQRRLWRPLLGFLKRGVSPEQLALCLAVGIVVGNIPILGVSSILCTVIALGFRLNLPAIQLVQWLMAPTQLLLIIPFVRLGEWIVHAPEQPLSLKAGRDLIAQGIGIAVRELWDAILHAGLAWLLVAPPAILILQHILTPVLRHAKGQLQRPAAA